jgi:hypothetical protein
VKIGFKVNFLREMPTFIPISFFKKTFRDKRTLNKFQPIIICNQCLKKQFEGRKIWKEMPTFPPISFFKKNIKDKKIIKYI